jgi:hypothetical protein
MVDFAPPMLLAKVCLKPIVAIVPDNIMFLKDPKISFYPPDHIILPNF